MSVRTPVVIKSGQMEQLQSGDSLALLNLTATRVPFAAANGELVDSANLTWDGSKISASNLRMPDTTSTVGILILGTTPFLHKFYDPNSLGVNCFVGGAGNFTLSAGGGATYLASKNCAIGTNCLYSLTTGYNNMAMGYGAAALLHDGAYNLAIGTNALYSNVSGGSSVALGNGAGYSTTGGNGIFIGGTAGYNETAGSTLYIDSYYRDTLAHGKSLSLLYGIFSSTAAAQLLVVNGVFEPYGLTAGRIVYSAAGTINTKLVDTNSMKWDGTNVILSGLKYPNADGTAGYILKTDGAGNLSWISTPATTFDPPVGSVLAWLKSYTNTPVLNAGWVECAGQTLSDSGSVYNGQVIPNLNGNSNFLKGDTTSGTNGTFAFTGATQASYTVVWIMRIK
jgi:hypothetical protein